MKRSYEDWTPPRQREAELADAIAKVITWSAIILIVVIAVWGCVPLAQQDDPSVDAQLSASELAECELEGIKASANVQSALEAGFVKIDVENKCRRIKALQKEGR